MRQPEQEFKNPPGTAPRRQKPRLPRQAMATVLAAAALAGTATGAEANLEEVIVVATRMAVSPDTVGNSVTVLNERLIRESQAIVVSDLLASTPGVTFARNGGPGTLTSVRIRGAESDQTLVLIDGVQMNDPSAAGGGFDFGNLLVGDISRIEILRGAQSTLYGSQAIGGVLNIITREPEGTLGGSLQGEIGSFQSGMFKGSMGGKFDRLSFRVGAGYYNTSSVSTFAGGQEKDPFRNSTVTARLGYEFTPDVALDLRAYYADGKSNYDGFPAPAFVFADEGDYSITRQFVSYNGLRFGLFGNRLQNRVAYQYTNNDRGLYLNNGLSVSRTGDYQGQNNRVEYQGTIEIADGYRAVFGLQHEQSEMVTKSEAISADVGQDSIYAQVQGEVAKGLTLTAGGRHDDHETFGTHQTGQFAVAWALDSGTVLRASVGQGFKAPTLYQLFSPYRNPGLEPEQSSSWDAGVEQRLMDRRVVLSATYFSRDTRNQIDFLSCTVPLNALCTAAGHSSFGYYQNTGRAAATGIELQASLHPVEPFEVQLNYTNMQAENRTPGSSNFGKRLPRRPDTSANLSVSYQWPVGLKTTVAARYSGASFDNAANSRRLDSYTLVDLRVAYALSDSMEMFGRLENAFDEEYETVYQYGTLGRSGFVGLSTKF